MMEPSVVIELPPAFETLRSEIRQLKDERATSFHDQCAMRAMQAICQFDPTVLTPTEVASDSYKFADAMVAERDRRKAK